MTAETDAEALTRLSYALFEATQAVEAAENARKNAYFALTNFVRERNNRLGFEAFNDANNRPEQVAARRKGMTRSFNRSKKVGAT